MLGGVWKEQRDCVRNLRTKPEVFRHLLSPKRQNPARGDRKSTRLNSSHSQISYAVFCLKKKKIYVDIQMQAAGCEFNPDTALRDPLDVRCQSHRIMR